MTPSEVRFWQKVSADLGVSLVTPVEISLSNGETIMLSALVKDFGAKRGMLVDANFALIQPYAKILVEDGYGYSSNFGHSPESYDRHKMIEILADWGWSGPSKDRPAWLA